MHHRRRIVHVNVTELDEDEQDSSREGRYGKEIDRDHPTAAWTARQMIEAFPNDTAPRWLLRDRDAVSAAT
jgi:hypothetical protein